MKPINNGEFGYTLYNDFEEDISSYTTFEMIILSQDEATETTKTATLGTSTITGTDIGTLTANQFVFYTTVDGDFETESQNKLLVWKYRWRLAKSGENRLTDWIPLRVKP